LNAANFLLFYSFSTIWHFISYLYYFSPLNPKKLMKIYALILSAAVLATACNSKPDAAATTSTTPTTDTGLVITQPELPVADTQQVTTTPATAEKANTGTAVKSGGSTSTSSGTSNSSSNGNTTADNASSGSSDASSGSTASSKEKKGWSKTAKGAVIGGVTGAAAGAIINKKNRGVGAVIGGVGGAAAGAVIGNEMDKKDGRH
jgi:outer membrane lipoprotein SlyB